MVRAGTASGVGAAQPGTDDPSARALLSATAADGEELAELDKALAEFEDSEASLQQRREAMIRARDAVDQLNMQAGNRASKMLPKPLHKDALKMPLPCSRNCATSLR